MKISVFLGIAMIGAIGITDVLNADDSRICFEQTKIGEWGIRADESNWKIFRRYNYVNFLSVFHDNISMIAHPKLPGIIEVALNGKPIVRHPDSRVEYNIRKPRANCDGFLPVEDWFTEQGSVEVVIGHRNETGEEVKFITNIIFDSAELVSVVREAREMQARIERKHRDSKCIIDPFKRVVIVPG